MKLRTVGLVGLLSLAACSGDSPTGAKPPVQVAITASAGTPSYETAPGDSIAMVTCELTLHAVATGKAGSSATWVGERFRFYAGLAHDVAVDSFDVSAADLQQSWNGAGIASGQAVDARWTVAAPFPFTIGGDVRWQSGVGPERTSTFLASCGPVSASAPPPSVSNLQVTPSSGELATGDSITVAYDVAAPAGLWTEEMTVVSGSATSRYLFRDGFDTAASRRRRFRTSYGSSLGAPVQVSVRVTDAWQRSASAGPAATAVLVDHTPPFLQVARLAPLYGVGDTLEISHVVEDDNALGWLVWELGSPVVARDSFPFTGWFARDVARIVVRPEWAGATQMRVWATDKGGNRSIVSTSGAGGITIVPVRPLPMRETHVAPWINDAVVDEPRGMLYAGGAGGVTIASLATPALVGRIAVPEPSTLDVSMSGDTVLAANDTLLSVIDLARSTTSTVRLSMPHLLALRIAANGKVLGVVRSGEGSALVEIDPATGAMQVRADDGAGTRGGSLTRSADHRRLLYNASCVRSYVADTDGVGACGPELVDGAALALDDGATLFASGPSLFGPGFAPIPTRLAAVGATGATAVAPDGGYAYAFVPRGLLKVARDGTILELTPLRQDVRHLLFAQGGATLVVLGNLTDGGHLWTVDLR